MKYGSGATLTAILHARARARTREAVEAYDEMTVAELQEAAKAADLPTSGTKAELIARLTGGEDA